MFALEDALAVAGIAPDRFEAAAPGEVYDFRR